MPTVRDILGDDFTTLLSQGKTDDEIISIAKQRYKNPPPQKIIQQTPQTPAQKKELPAWYRGETDNGLINFGGDVLRGAGKTGLNYLNVLQDTVGVDNSKTTKMLQKLDAITEEHKDKNRTPQRKAEVKKLNEAYKNADTFSEKFGAGVDTVVDTLKHNPVSSVLFDDIKNEWQIGEFLGENLDPINALPVAKGFVAGASVGSLTNGVQAGVFAQARHDKSTLDAAVEGSLGAASGAVLGGVVGGNTKGGVEVPNESNYNAAYEGLGVDGEKKYPREAYSRAGRNPEKVDGNGILIDPFDTNVKKRTYDKFANVIHEEEANIVRVDAEIKKLGYAMELKGASPEEVEVAVEQKFLPSPKALEITNVINDGLPVTPRLSGLNIQQAVINSIENSKKTKSEFYESMKKHGFVDEIAVPATKAYEEKNITPLSVAIHDKLTRNMDKIVDIPAVKAEVKKDLDIKKIAKSSQKDTSYDLAYDALPVEEKRTSTQQSALFGNEQQLFDVPSETKLQTPRWAEPLVSDTIKYEDIVKAVTDAKNGEKPNALAKRAMSAMAKEELTPLVNHPRFNDVLEFAREIDSQTSKAPNLLVDKRKVSTVDAQDGYKTIVEGATYEPNYAHDFLLSRPRVKRIESGKPTLQDVEILKQDLDMMDNNPRYRVPTEEELKAKFDEWQQNPERIYDYDEYDKLEQKFSPETYAEKQDLFGETQTQEEIQNDTSYTRDLARDSQNTGTTNTTHERVDATRGAGDGAGTQLASTPFDEVRQQSDSSASNSVTSVLGEQSNTELHSTNAADAVTSSTSRSGLTERSGGTHESGVQPGQDAGLQPSTEPQPQTKQSSDASMGSSPQGVEERRAAQKRAEIIPLELNNPQNIHDTLPILLPKQREDVIKAESRFYDADERGMLFTNGTGTGKTFTGLGVIKRFEKMGKKDIVVLVPSEAKALDWIEDAELLNLKIRKLKDTKDSGEGSIVVTTYENLRNNKGLVDRDIDLLVADESHKIMGNKDGKHTANLEAVQMLTNHYTFAKQRAREKFDPQMQALNKNIETVGGRYEKEAMPFIQKQKELKEQELQYAMDLNKKTKTVFLSASPFASHKALRYADDYILNFDKDKWSNEGHYGAYNSGSEEDKFFISNFGYKMRYNKLTRPDAEVNVDLMERAFSEKLKKSGAMSGRMLDVDKDYERAFVLVDSEIGNKIDAGFEKLSEDDTLPNLRSAMRSSYMDTVSLMESIKAHEAVSRIKEHLALGRKVVVYHTFVNSIPKHPFQFDAHINKAISLAGGNQAFTKKITAEYAAYKSKYPELYNMDLGGLDTPTATIKEAFGDSVVMFNGLEKKSQKPKNIKMFNDNEVDIIMVNESGKEGISLHDKLGDKQRVLINLSLPIKPIDMIQVEGRIYRTGQKSDAIFEYLTLHTNFEKRYFGSSINERVATVENLAMGDMSRNLRSSIKEGYLDADTYKASDLTGAGGKESDARAEGDTATSDPFAYAKTLFFGKKKGRQNHRGNDFFATPEPLGFKMVEWADIKANERVLEPSAGEGAIGKWFPPTTTNHFIEQSGDLFSDLSVAVAGKVQNMSFEHLDVINKYDAIVMNPPYGRASKLAIEHLQKAMSHTAMNGRIVLLAPNNMKEKASFKKMLEDKKFSGWVQSDEIKLPEVTFSRAGTKVMTSVYVFDKTASKEMLDTSSVYPTTIDAENINDFFDAIEGLEIEPRSVKSVAEVSKSISNSVSGDMPLKIGVFKHTKTGENKTVVRIADRVSREEYKAFSNEIKKFGGYWSSRYAKGFLFKDEAQAELFKQGVDDGSVKLNAMFFPYADKIADIAVNFDKYVDKAYDTVSNFLRDVDENGVPKAVRESNSKPEEIANNFFGWLRDNMALGGGRANHYLEILRDYTNEKGAIAHEAMANRKALSYLSKDDSADLVRALGGDLPLSELPHEMLPIYEKFRKLIDTQTEELVKAGALDEKYVKENYIKRYYFEHIAKEKSFVNMKGSAANSEKFARSDLDLEDRIAMGQLEDASYVVAKTIMEQKDQLNRARFFNKLADEIAVDEMVDGFVQVPDTKLGVINKWGALNGKYIPKQVFDDLKGAAKMFDDLSGMEKVVAYWFSGVQHIKTNMTVKNLGTHFYNIQSNGYIAYLDGHMIELARVVKDKALYKELHNEANRFGLDSMLDDLEGVTFKEHSKSGLLTTILKNAYMAEGTKVGNAMRTAYAYEDNVFKLAAYLKRKEAKQLDKFLNLEGNKGLKDEYDSGIVNAYLIAKKYHNDIKKIDLSEDELRNAFEGVDEVYVNYSTPLPAGVKNLDRSGLMPFLHYSWKATPIFLKQMLKHPFKVAMLHVLGGYFGISQIWGDQDERDKVTPEWMNNGFNLLGLDNYKEIFDSEYFNIGRSVPGMRFMNESPLSVILGFDGGIFANMFGIVAQGRDNKGYNVDGNKYDSTSVHYAKRLSAIAEQAMPPLFPAIPLVIRPKVDSHGREIKGTNEIVSVGGRYFQKAYDAVGGKKDKRGNPLEVVDVVKQASGLKLQKVDKLMYAQKSANNARKLYEREYNIAKSTHDRAVATKKYKAEIKLIKKQMNRKDIAKLKVKMRIPGKKSTKIGRVFTKKRMIEL